MLEIRGRSGKLCLSWGMGVAAAGVALLAATPLHPVGLGGTGWQERPERRPISRATARDLAPDILDLGSNLEGRAEYSSIVVDRDGTPWIFWDQCDRDKSRVLACRIENGQLTSPEPISPLGHVAFTPAAAVDSAGQVWVCWAWWHDGEWDIEGRVFDGRIWRSTKQMVREPGNDLAPALATDARGRMWLVWQVLQDSDSEIFAKYWEHGIESEKMSVGSGSDLDDFRPAVCAGERGELWTVWDGWKDGLSEIYLSHFDGDHWSSPRNISDNPGYDCYRPDCVAHPSGGLWVSWNVVTRGESEWGTAIAKVTAMAVDPALVPPGLVPKATNFAQVALDIEDRPWVVWQERQPTRRWKVLACAFDGKRWAGPFPVHDQGPVSKQFAPCVASTCGGDLWVAWAWNQLMAATVTGEVIGRLTQSSFDMEPLAWERNLPEAFNARMDGRTSVRAGSGRYQLYWGDLHNHSELSDGRQPIDHCYELARDVYGLDFICTADHDINITEGEWRLTQALAAIMNDPGRFAAFSGYESSYLWAKIGAGHRNIVQPVDEGRICRFHDGVTLPELLHCVRVNRGMAIPHHIGRWFAPINWDDFDAEIQPIVEICSVHGIFEYFGNPWKPRPEYLPAPAVDRNKQPVEGSFVQDGWARGHRFGVVGSTDSHINHSYGIRRMALAAVYAEDLTRQGLFEAFRARRTYGTTGVRAILDFRVNGHIMGDEFELRQGRPVTVRVEVDAPIVIEHVDIVRDNETVYSVVVNDERVHFSWEDPAPSEYSTYYYARVVMAEDNYAWSSPVWIDWE